MDNMPDFDSMTPEEMMAWMEALAKRQGAQEGLFMEGDIEVPEIDPDSVGDIDEPGYIPFGMDPEVWAQKKAKEDAARAERIAAMKADKDKTAPVTPAQTPPAFAEEPAATPVSAANPLDFLADLSGMAESPDTSPFAAADEPEQVSFNPQPVDAAPSFDEMFADLSGAVIPELSGDMNWLADLGQGAVDLPNFDDLDFGSLESLDVPVGQTDSNPLEWLESLVGDSDSARALANDAPDAGLEAVAAHDDDMRIDGDEILEDSAVSAVLNDPMEWLADFADTQPMDAMAVQAANSREILAMSDDLDAFFDRIQPGEEGESLADFDLNKPMGELVETGLLDFGGTPSFDDDDVSVSSALTQGTDVPPEDVKAWMDSLLDRGIARTDVVDDDESAELEAEVLSELPSWLIEQVGEMPSQDEVLSASGDDLPEWLTAPVSDSQNAEFEEMFSQMSSEVADLDLEPQLPEFDGDVAPLDTGVIRVQMNDPWVEAFELERDERLTDTGRLAAWYESAAHEVQAAQRASEENPVVPVAAVTSESALKAAQLPSDDELPHGEPQAVPTWLGGQEPVAPTVTPSVSDVMEPAHLSEEELPDWLRAAQLESDDLAEVPSWLTDSLSTDEFEILQLGGQPDATAIQDEPTTPVPVQQQKPLLTQTAMPTPISQRPTSELPRIGSPRIPREIVAPHEAANVINQARASQKMGDMNAMIDAYERLVRSEVALEDVEADMEKVAKDAVHKTNPSVLRVYGDVLLRRGKLQQALDTYRAALNLL